MPVGQVLTHVPVVATRLGVPELAAHVVQSLVAGPEQVPQVPSQGKHAVPSEKNPRLQFSRQTVPPGWTRRGELQAEHVAALVQLMHPGRHGRHWLPLA